MLHVVQISSVHQPADSRIFSKECVTLAKAGHRVSFVVPHERDEVISGVNVHGTPKHKGRLSRILRTTTAVFLKARQLDGDVYHFHDSELIPYGILLKLLGKKVIYDVHEDLPLQILNKPWIPALLRRPIAGLAGLMERIGTLFFDRVVVATPPIGKNFPPSKTVVVQNFPIIEEFQQSQGIAYTQRKRRLVYVGGVAPIRGIFEMLDALHASNDATLRLDIAGPIQGAALQEQLQQHPGWQKVKFHGFLSRTGVAELIGQCRVGLVPLHPCPNYLESYPIKLFEYMAAGIPVIASNFPLWRSIIDSAKCGLTVDPLDPKQILGAATWLLDNEEEAAAMGERGRRAVYEMFNWQGEAAKLVAMYASLRRTDKHNP